MEKLKLSTGVISLEIVGDDDVPRGVFKFDPTDIACAKKLFALIDKCEAKTQELAARAADVKEGDGKGMAGLLLELVEAMRNGIDNVYGEGSSQILFGDSSNISMINSFFDGIAPYYKKASLTRISRHTKKYHN